MEIKRVTRSGYIWDKRFFWGALVLMILALWLILSLNNFDLGPNFYYVCNNTPGCANPVYDAHYKTWLFGPMLPARDACDWCAMPYLAPGAYGKPQPSYFTDFFCICFSSLLLALVLNHLAHNQGKKLDLGLDQYDKYKKYVKEDINDKD